MSESDDPVIEEAKRLDDQIAKESGGQLRLITPLVRTSAERKEERHEERVEDARAAAAAAQGPQATAPSAQDLIRPVVDPSKRKRRLAAASVLTRDWLPPTLGTPGLVGRA